MPAAPAVNGLALASAPLANSCAAVSRPGVEAVVLGCVLTIVTLLVPIPQARKVFQHRSSAGVSVPTLFLTVVFGCANLGSTVAVKWRTIESCGTDGAGCVTGLLDVLQQVASAGSWTATLLCVLAYPPANVRRNVVSTAALLLVCSGIVASSVGVAAAHPCSDGSLGLSEALGWLGGVCAVVQFAPQLYSTWAKGGSGSLSYATYTFMAIGSAAVATNQIAFQRDTWPVSWRVEAMLLCFGGNVIGWWGLDSQSNTKYRRPPARHVAGELACRAHASLLWRKWHWVVGADLFEVAVRGAPDRFG
jgi:uncharacterized protein with PQ loop repeat